MNSSIQLHIRHFVGIGNTNNFKVSLAIATALPATLLLVNTTLRFEDRAQWFWKKRLGTQRLLRELRDTENPDIYSVAKRFADFSDSMESAWPDFGTPQRQGQSNINSSN
ncbi:MULTISPECIES: hypothetical protein [unclassified Pseudomonas]|uniref:hypothetical protein n=1 Tax=unclassified Pseudomonas TaxID=196821 RepID=UPI00244A5347|nr:MULTISPECIES: hypothetical protein [unclassified Pseudomonas]MDH0895003.1 hypothetical protein [Pseudomonas sp. GD03875]MDH1065382.1 hypothetical protein [Pseudomonas sp. GD03985]